MMSKACQRVVRGGPSSTVSLLGGSMRIGNRLGIAVVGAWFAATSVSLAADVARRVQPVPLGGSLSGQSGDQHYGVYVPTQFGGVLTVSATDGKVGTITGPDGRERTNGEEVGNN